MADEQFISVEDLARVEGQMVVVAESVDLIVSGAAGALHTLPDRAQAWVTLSYLVGVSARDSRLTLADSSEMVALLAIRLVEAQELVAALKAEAAGTAGTPGAAGSFTWTGDWPATLAWLNSIAPGGRWPVPVGTRPPLTVYGEQLHVCTPSGCRLVAPGQAVRWSGTEFVVPVGAPAPVNHTGGDV